VSVLAACRSDGRTLRQPRPDQTGTVSAPTTPVEDQPAFVDPNSALGEATNGLGGVGDPLLGEPSGAVFAPWADGGTIQARYTCDGENVQPAISWPTAPEGTVSIGVAMIDRDAPDYAHWAMSGINPDFTGLAENARPAGVTVGINSSGVSGYTGPCPPGTAAPHNYDIVVFFLDSTLDVSSDIAGTALVSQMTAAAFDSASVRGVYSRS
jgi:Raf kinase inhibitor-like YbhB/YbcL family protein